MVSHFFALLVMSCTVMGISAWSVPHHHPRAPMRFTRFAPHPAHHHRLPIPLDEVSPATHAHAQRPKRDHDEHDHDHGHDHGYHHRDHDHKGITGPVHTFIKTDKNANYKWGVRHHVGSKFAS